MTQKSHEKNLNTCTFPMEMNTCTKKNTKKKSKKFTDDTNNKNWWENLCLQLHYGKNFLFNQQAKNDIKSKIVRDS